MKQVNWFERNFEFNISQNIFPSVIERLQGTPVRLEHKLRSIPETFFDVKVDDTWSVKENIGHLTDLEPLWQTRLKEIINGDKIMSAADLQNTKTSLQKHNDSSIEELLNSFIKLRKETIDMLEKIEETIIFKSALHPRINKPMRTIDLFQFVAEHDDHHMARISEIFRVLIKH